MDQHLIDFDLDPTPADALESDPTATPPRPTRTLTNSPNCAPAPARSLRSAEQIQRAPIRRVRTDAWSVPASASWARPSRALRKVARRAVDNELIEPA
ncbi:MAG: hypothetical protein R3F21_18615 [Myxococcota bacterium]